MSVKQIPDGFTAVTPYFVIDDVAGEIEFVSKAFNAQLHFKSGLPGGKIMHADVMINGAHIMMGSSSAKYPALPSLVYLYLIDADAAFDRAVAAGASVVSPMANQFYGDRSGTIKDKNGIMWSISLHIEDVTPAELGRRAQAQGRA